jgi:hypothetical protein
MAFLHSLDARPSRGSLLIQGTGTERGAHVRATKTSFKAKRKIREALAEVPANANPRLRLEQDLDVLFAHFWL